MDVGALVSRAVAAADGSGSPLTDHGGAALSVVQGFLSTASRQQGLLRLRLDSKEDEACIEGCITQYLRLRHTTLLYCIECDRSY